eukprot:4993754-Prymnesium_polylepis.1
MRRIRSSRSPPARARGVDACDVRARHSLVQVVLVVPQLHVLGHRPLAPAERHVDPLDWDALLLRVNPRLLVRPAAENECDAQSASSISCW